MSTPTPLPIPVPTFPTSGRAYRTFFDSLGSLFAAAKHPSWWRAVLDVPLKIVLVIVASLALRWIINRFIDRIAEGIASGHAGLARLDDRLPSATALFTSPTFTARRQARARTTASVLRSATSATVAVMATLTVLQILQVGFTTALASVGVLGIAVGLGAQAVIKDLIAGVFMIVEDQYGVGDVVDLGEATGTVESVGLRVTRLRDDAGTVWYLRNGEIGRVGNRSQGWARAMLDVVVAKDQDVARAQRLLLEVAAGLADDETFTAAVIGEPQVWGIESVTADGVAVRLVVKTQPLQQWDVARELRRRILDRFEAEGLPAPVGLESPDFAPVAPGATITR